MPSPAYKHYLSISSQISFCSAPIRLDSYNHCQYSCSYCFARARTGHGRMSKLHSADPHSLEKRLQRISNGLINSALDEFISIRTPIQFGGMSDPFIPLERKKRSTLRIIKILKSFNYPFLLSTKGDLIFEKEYIEATKNSNSLVRFSFSGCSKELRDDIERGTLRFENFIDLAPKLRDVGIKFGVRLQPLVPGEETHAIRMIRALKHSGVKHISCEFLKVPPSARKHFGSAIQKHFSGDIIEHYRSIGAQLRGNEFFLPAGYRKRWLDRMANETHEINATFGYADNDLLLFSDGSGCCSGSDIHLANANNFRANTLGLLKFSIEKNKKPSFDDINNFWHPNNNIAQYLNSKSRIYNDEIMERSWINYARAAWEGRWGQYQPRYFITPDNS